MKYKICDGCGANIDATSRACVSCGKRQTYGKKTYTAKAKLMECPTCGNAVSENARTCPQCGEEFETRSSGWRNVMIGFLLVLPLCILIGLSSSEPTPAGFSSWDGSHIQLVKHTKLRLKDPDSFQHIGTNVLGGGKITMHYRARNSFGGMVVGKISARYDPSTGDLIEVTPKE